MSKKYYEVSLEKIIHGFRRVHAENKDMNERKKRAIDASIVSGGLGKFFNN